MNINYEGIHIIEKGNLILVLDVESGSLHQFDELSLSLLRQYRDRRGVRPEGMLKDSEEYGVWEDLDQLVQEGLLFSPGEETLTQRIPAGYKSMCLNIAHDCNLACAYCFANQGDFGGTRSIMSPETGRRAVDFLMDNSGSRRLLEVDFFGGEPLMGWETVQAVIEYADREAPRRGKRFKYSLTTNGVLLSEEKRKYLAEHQVSLVLSLDGRPETNDRMRCFNGGSPSYSVIVPHYHRVRDNSEDYVVRGTYTRMNLDFASDVLHMADEGFKHLSMEPAVFSGDVEFALRESDLPAIQAEYDRLAEAWLARWEEGRPMDFFHFNVDISGGPCIYKRVSACGAGYEYLAVTPEGDLYPCHQFVGQPEYRMGTLEKGILREDLPELFRDTHIYSKEECKTCWAKFYCSGGCHANAQEFNGTIRRPYELGCAIQKSRLEAALYVQAAVKIRSVEGHGEEKTDSYRNDLYVYGKMNEILKRIGEDDDTEKSQ